MLEVVLKSGREGPIRHGHPWVFSGAIARVSGDVAGRISEVDVLDARRNWLGRGLYQPGSSLAVRLYSYNEKIRVDEAFFGSRIAQALEVREALALMNPQTDAWRLVFSEADGLSGLIVDRYAGTLVVQVADILLPFLGVLCDCLRSRTGCRKLHVMRAEAGNGSIPRFDQILKACGATEPSGPVMIRENGLIFSVDPAAGQKTGFFLDQRDNRCRVARYAKGRRVFSGFCYTGAFEVYAAAAGARSVTGVDSSAGALQRAREHMKQAVSNVDYEYVRADVHVALRNFRDRGANFDLIILDPPAFISSGAGFEKGLRAYKDINLLAMKLLAPGGILASFSCSGRLSATDFRRVLGWAARDAGCNARILESLAQPPDHPVHPCIPETHYLKGVICRIDRL